MSSSTGCAQWLAEIVVIGASPLKRVLVVLRLLERYPRLAEATGHQLLVSWRCRLGNLLGVSHCGLLAAFSQGSPTANELKSHPTFMNVFLEKWIIGKKPQNS